MRNTDLRRSNAVYIYRSILNNYKSAEEIAKETEMSVIAVKKILYNLFDRDILSKYKDAEKAIGRPKIYFGLNSRFSSILIKKEPNEFTVIEVSINGKIVSRVSFPLNYGGLSESGSLRMLRAALKSHNGLKFNLGIFLIGDDIEALEDLPLIKKTTDTQLVLDSLYNEDLVIFAEIKDEKYLLNHGKTKKVTQSYEELTEIIDLDLKFNISNLDDESLIEALRLNNILKLEEKI